MDKKNNSNHWENVDQAEEKAEKAYEFFEQGKFSQALKEIDFSIMICPNNSSWRFDKGLILDAMFRWEDAIREYEFFLSLLPNSLETLIRLGIDYTRIGQYKLALDVFEAAQEIGPSYEPCYCNRIIVYAETGQKDLAEQMFYLAQGINPDCEICYYNMGALLFANKDYKRTIYCWSKVAELKFDYPQINYYLARAYWMEGDKEVAQEFFLKELRQNPGNIDAILDFGLLLIELNEIQSAREKFNRILGLEPNFVSALFYLGEIAFNQKDYGEAENFFKRASEQGGIILGLNYRLACCGMIKGLKAETRAYLLKELKNSGNMKKSVLNSSILASAGSIFLVLKDIDSAMHCQLRAIDLDANNPEAYYSLGIISLIKGNLNDAVDFLDQALNLIPDSVFFIYAYSLALLMAGKMKEAERVIKNLLNICSSRELKKIKHRIWLIRHLPQKTAGFAKKLLLVKLEQKTLKIISSFCYETICYSIERKPYVPLMTQGGIWIF